MATKVLEIHLISAQGLKPPAATNPRSLQSYAVVWVDPSNKLRTRIDRVGGENPTWNDKFLFKVDREYLSSETAGVSFELYAVGRLRNPLIGSVRFLVSNLPLTARTPSFFPLHIQRPSGRFQGVLNVGATVIEGSDLMKGLSAIGYRDLMGESFRRRGEVKKAKVAKGVKKGDALDGEKENSASFGDNSTSGESSSDDGALQEWNRFNRSLSLSRSPTGGGILCGLGLNMQRRFSLCLPDQNLPPPTSRGWPRKQN